MITMSEYVYSELHETDESIEMRWLYDGKIHALVMGHEMFEQTIVEPDQRAPALMELLVFDPNDAGSGEYFEEDCHG